MRRLLKTWRWVKFHMGAKRTHRDNIAAFIDEMLAEMTLSRHAFDDSAVMLSLRVFKHLGNTQLSPEDRLEHCWKDLNEARANRRHAQLQTTDHELLGV